MTTILFTFIVAFMFALVLTPVAKWQGKRFGALDNPSARKVHTRPIPRSGGLAILFSGFLAIAVCILLATKASELLYWNEQRVFCVLGVPIFDTLLSPVRRFILGQRMFQPDKGHVHHRLFEVGLSSSRTVLIIYGVTCVLCVMAIMLANLRNEMVGLLLIVLGAEVLITVRKLGYLEYFATDKIYGWLRDLSDEAGFTHDSRSFLSLQIEIGNARNLEALWGNVCRAMEIMHIDRGELHLLEKEKTGRESEIAGFFETAPVVAYDGGERRRTRQGQARGGARVYATDGGPGRAQDSPGSVLVRVWARGHHWRREDVLNDGMLRIEIPLGVGKVNLFRLVLLKNLSWEPVHPYTLRRVEHLRRSVMSAINRLHPAPEPAFAASDFAVPGDMLSPAPMAVDMGVEVSS